MTNPLLQKINKLESYLSDLSSLSCDLYRLGYEEESDELDEISMILKCHLYELIKESKQQKEAVTN